MVRLLDERIDADQSHMCYRYDIDSDETIDVVLNDFKERIRNVLAARSGAPFFVELGVGSTDGAAVY